MNTEDLKQGKSCTHFQRKELLSRKSRLPYATNTKCSVCKNTGTNLYGCLYENCDFIGCSDTEHDHGTVHFERNGHGVQMHLTTRRIWCYYCNDEVRLDDNDVAATAAGVLACLLQPYAAVDADRGGLVGLRNIGNTCYMNSALQALSNLPPLACFFLTSGDLISTIVGAGQSSGKKIIGLAPNYQRLMQEMWYAPEHRAVMPAILLNCLRSRHVMFRGYQQHDTQEFLRCFIDQLHEELKDRVIDYDAYAQCSRSHASTDDDSESELRSCSNTASDTDSEYETCESSVSESELVHLPNELRKEPKYKFSSIISDVFDGKLISSVQCLTCNVISAREETFQDLSLPIPNDDSLGVCKQTPAEQAAVGEQGWLAWLWSLLYGNWSAPTVTLHKCMASFFSVDELNGDNMYSCDNCKKLRMGIKFSKVMQLPEILCIHLKRFRHDLCDSKKISTHVEFPLEGFDVRAHLHQECKSQISEYTLVSVICHHGSVSSGHYTCYSRNHLNDRWYEYNDECVREVTPSEVQGSEAYVLFYQKHNPQCVGLRERALTLQQTQPFDDDGQVPYYVARSWLLRFASFAEPGPVDNYELLCPHGRISHSKIQHFQQLAVPVSPALWQFLHNAYGGGPAISALYFCAICKQNADALARRRQCELSYLERYGVGDLESETNAVFAISMTWLREWEEFIKGTTHKPPGAINNNSIATQQTIAGATTAVSLRTGSYYTQISEPFWNFLLQTYGGGPEIMVRSALGDENSEDERHSVECDPQDNDCAVEQPQQPDITSDSTTTLISIDQLLTPELKQAADEGQGPETPTELLAKDDDLAILLNDTAIEMQPAEPTTNQNAKKLRSPVVRANLRQKKRRRRRGLKRSGGMFGVPGHYKSNNDECALNGNGVAPLECEETATAPVAALANGKSNGWLSETSPHVLCNGAGGSGGHKNGVAQVTLKKYNTLSESSLSPTETDA